jgi:amino acid adenylation domain-containing protein
MDNTVQRGLPTRPARRTGPTNSFIRFDKREIEQSVPRRFESAAATYRDRIAVKDEGRAFTYEFLNGAANRVARAVLERGVGGAARPVALLLEKGATALAAMLGVLKTGRPQTTLDTSFPVAHLSTLLENSGASLVVTNDRHSALANELAGAGLQVLNVDAVGAEYSGENLCLPISPDAPAHIIYTSGSTGAPKGVCVEHRTMLHRMMRQTNSLRVSAEDRLSHLASFSTSQGLSNIFCALLNGAGLYLFDVKAEGLDRVADWLVEERITVYRSSASLFRHLNDTLAGRKEFPHLRLVRLASEQVTKRDIEGCRRLFPPDCLLMSGLSSTETGLVREYFIDGETPLGDSRVPVGYAVEDMEVLLLGEDGRGVAPGGVGEIVVRSRYLPRGYWRNPALTASVFRPDPEGGESRVYMTGDLGRMLPGGLLEHVGRKDFQVKIRGNRIEVSEVEAALLAHAAVREAAVTARDDVGGQRGLVAYVVAEQNSRPAAEDLHRFLRQRLPDYMVPSAFVTLDAMPLTPGGKVDRAELPPPPAAAPDTSDGHAAPTGFVEESVARIWCEVLGLARVGVNHNFFMIGGHSLLAGMVIHRLNSAFGIDLPPRALFDSPTVSGLALTVEERVIEQVESLDEDEARDCLSRTVSSGEGGTHGD